MNIIVESYLKTIIHDEFKFRCSSDATNAIDLITLEFVNKLVEYSVENAKINKRVTLKEEDVVSAYQEVFKEDTLILMIKNNLQSMLETIQTTKGI